MVMYPSIKHSLDIETNGSYSKAVTGIIIITLAFTVGLIILGVWEPEQNGIQQENINIPFVPENKISDESSSEPTSSEDLSEEIISSSETTEEDFSDAAVSGSSDVLVLEVGSVCDLDTVAGTLEIVDSNLPSGPLPLCMDQAWLDQWYVVVDSYGGYEFIDGLMVIKQKDIADQYIKIYASDRSTFRHPFETYQLKFELCDPEHPIVIESNHVPTIIGDWFCVIPDQELAKRVDLFFVTTWTGCFQPDQEFLVILAHKAMSQK